MALVVPTANASAQAFSTVLDIDFEDLDFSGPTLASGTALAEGAVYAYDAVYSVGGTTVDATITIVAIENSTIGIFDDTTNPARFEPTINSGDGGGYVEYRIDLFDQDGDPIGITNFALTGVDIDGSADSREYHEIGGFNTYEVDNATELVVTPGNPLTRFLGIDETLPNITFEDRAAYIAEYTEAEASLTFRLGNTGNPDADRLYSIAIGSPAGSFSDAVLTNAPGVFLSTTESEVDGSFEVTATFSEEVTGLTEGDIIVTNGTVEPGSLRTTDGITYTFTVIPNGEGEVTVRIPSGSAESDFTTLPNASSNTLRVLFDEPGGDDDADGDGTFSDDDPDDTDPCVPSNTVPACDSDGDGLPDGLEVETDPGNADTDGDGLCDGAIAVEGVCDAGEDLDGDGVVDEGETDPTNPDTDGGGVSDGDEAADGRDPLDPDDDEVKAGELVFEGGSVAGCSAGRAPGGAGGAALGWVLFGLGAGVIGRRRVRERRRVHQ